MKIKKHLSLAPLIDRIKSAFDNYKDTRRTNSTSYSVLDTALSGLACMFYKSENMVNYQERMEKKYHKNNRLFSLSSGSPMRKFRTPADLETIVEKESLF